MSKKKLFFYQVLYAIVLLTLSVLTSIILLLIPVIDAGDFLAVLVASTAFYYLLISKINNQTITEFRERQKKVFVVIDVSLIDHEQLEKGIYDSIMANFGQLSPEEYQKFKSLSADLDKLTFLLNYKINKLKRPSLSNTHIISDQKAIIEYVD